MRTAIVTGGTRGLGRDICIGLRDAGDRVAAVYHGNDTTAKAFHEETSIPVYKWDVADFDACADGIQRVSGDLGPPDILVNNAGITRDVTLHHMQREQWEAVLRTNLDSMFNMCRHAVGGMRSRGFGRIVNIGSINGQKGQIGQVNYAASKAGILGFTRALALESAGKGITVNAVAPGYCDTDMVAAVKPEILDAIIESIPMRRLGRGDDVARMVVFLTRDNNDFVTGATFSVNGGQYLN